MAGQKAGVGGPELIRLNHFGALLHAAYSEVPFLVGSAARGKNWRDVDVRMILPSERFTQMFGETTRPRWRDPLFALLCASISAYAETTTGLPVDFQFQSLDDAEECYAGLPRVPLGIWSPSTAASGT